MQFKNTRETVGAIVEVSTGRTVQVKLTREDRRILEEIEFFAMESYAAVESFGPVGVYLKGEITSDTFKGGLQSKLLNLREVHSAWTQAYNNRFKG